MLCFPPRGLKREDFMNSDVFLISSLPSWHRTKIPLTRSLRRASVCLFQQKYLYTHPTLTDLASVTKRHLEAVLPSPSSFLPQHGTMLKKGKHDIYRSSHIGCFTKYWSSSRRSQVLHPQQWPTVLQRLHNFFGQFVDLEGILGNATDLNVIHRLWSSEQSGPGCLDNYTKLSHTIGISE